MADFMKAMKQMQKMKADMDRMQEELTEKTVTGTAGGGMVKAVVSGDIRVKSIAVDPSVVDSDDVEMLEDLVAAAVNDGIQKIHELTAKEMEKITGGLKIPGLL